MHVSSYLDPSGYAGGKFGIEVYMPTSDWKRSAPASRFSFIVSSRKVRALELRFLYAQYTYSLLRLIRSLYRDNYGGNATPLFLSRAAEFFV